MKDRLVRRKRPSALIRATVVAGLCEALASAAEPRSDPKFDRAPDAVIEIMTMPTSSVGFPGFAWRQPVVTVAFNGIDQHGMQLIADAASDWLPRNSAVTLSFKNEDGSFRTWSEAGGGPKADVRIGFSTIGERSGYWSAIGKYAAPIPAGQQTMNLDEVGSHMAKYGSSRSGEWRDSYDHHVVMHEFGHALGLLHEQLHPVCQKDLKIEEAVSEFGRSEHWSREQALFQFDLQYVRSKFNNGEDTGVDASKKPDRHSVMLYTLKPELFRAGVLSDCVPPAGRPYATGPSVGDRQAIARMYVFSPAN